MRSIFNLDQHEDVHPQVARDFKHNFIVNVADMAAWFFGDSFTNSKTILPVFMSTITSSPILIGLATALVDAGWSLPQVFMVSQVERLERKLPTVIWLGLFERLAFLALAAAALWAPKMPHTIAVSIVMLIIAWRGISSGLVALAWQELIATVIPVFRRGAFFGISTFIGQGLGMAASVVAAVLLVRVPYPQNFAAIFFISFIFVMVSFVFLILNREPQIERPESKKPEPLSLRRIRAVLDSNSNFRQYLITRSLYYTGMMPFSFMAVYGIERFGFDDAYVGVFNGIFIAGAIISNLVSGYISDRFGNKPVLILDACCWIAALVLTLAFRNVILFYVVFFLMGIANAARTLGDFNLAMEFGGEDQRPLYIGLFRAMTGTVGLLAPMIAGVLIQLLGYEVTFILSLGFAALGLVTFYRGVRDPRRLVRVVAFSRKR